MFSLLATLCKRTLDQIFLETKLFGSPFFYLLIISMSGTGTVALNNFYNQYVERAGRVPNVVRVISICFTI